MKQPRAKTRNLRESCVLEAMAIIGETGIEELSLRDMARRLGVSHQAPYKHYHRLDHLSAEIVSRAFGGLRSASRRETTSLGDHPTVRRLRAGGAEESTVEQNPLISGSLRRIS
jgi:AcrR family transcriptional regulator